jgi:hypothetical protein
MLLLIDPWASGLRPLSVRENTLRDCVSGHRFVVDPELRDTGRFPSAFKVEVYASRGDGFELMYVGVAHSASADDVDPFGAIPIAQTVRINAAFRTVPLSREGLNERDRIEYRRILKLYLDPPRILAIVTYPISAKVIVVCEIRSNGRRTAARERGLRERQVWRGDVQ